MNHTADLIEIAGCHGYAVDSVGHRLFTVQLGPGYSTLISPRDEGLVVNQQAFGAVPDVPADQMRRVADVVDASCHTYEWIGPDPASGDD